MTGFLAIHYYRYDQEKHFYSEGFAGMSIAIVFVPFRAVSAISVAILTTVTLSVSSILGGILNMKQEASSIVLNMLLSTMPLVGLFPKLASILRLKQTFNYDRTTQSVERQLLGHHDRVLSVLRHIVSSQYHPQVLAGKVVLDVASDITALHMDLSGFTAWVANTSSTSVLKVLNMLFSAFDRFAVRVNVMKLWQAGDGWAAISLPQHGIVGRHSMLKLAVQSFAILKKVNQTCEVNLKLRVGYSHNSASEVEGYVVLWGRMTKSLDFYSRIMAEAVALEHSGLEGGIHVSAAVFEVLMSDGLLSPRVREYSKWTDTGVWFPVSAARCSSCCADVEVSTRAPHLSPPVPGRLAKLGASLVPATTAPSSFVRLVALVAKTACWDRRFFVSGIGSLRAALGRLFASFLMMCLLMVDLFMHGTPTYSSAEHFLERILPLAVPSVVAIIYFLCVLALVTFWNSGFSSRVAFVTSMIVILIRPLITVPCFLIYSYPREVFSRFLVLGLVPFLVHPPVPFLVTLLVTVVPLNFIAVFEAYQRGVWLYAMDFDNIRPLAVTQGAMFAFLFAAVLSSAHQFVRLQASRKTVHDRIRLLRRQRAELTTLVSSFLPLHCQELMYQGGDFSQERVRDGGVLFMRIYLADSENAFTLPILELLNEQLSSLDQLFHECPFMYKVKTIQQTYFCVSQTASVAQILGQAGKCLRSLVSKDKLFMCIGVHVGDFVAGVIGEERWCWDCVGPAINEASRLADTALPNGVSIRKSLLEESGAGQDVFSVWWNVVDHQSVELKGVGQVEICILTFEEKDEEKESEEDEMESSEKGEEEG